MGSSPYIRVSIMKGHDWSSIVVANVLGERDVFQIGTNWILGLTEVAGR